MREKKEMGQKIKSTDILRTIIGLLLLFVGFYIMSSIDLHIGYVQEFTLLIFSIVGVTVIFGNQALIWFSKPQGRYTKIAIACLIINTIWSMLGGTIVALIFGNSGNHANAVFGDYGRRIIFNRNIGNTSYKVGITNYDFDFSHFGNLWINSF